jgi:hypothetical protein
MRRFVRRSADIDMAWGKRFLRRRKDVVPTYDFCFFGGLTARRERVLNEVVRRGFKLDLISHSTSLVARDARISLSRVVLDVKQHHWWDLISSVRYTTALGQGRPVVAEARSAQARADWEGVVRFAQHDRFIETAAHSLLSWERLHEVQAAALRRKPDTLGAAIAMLPPPQASSAHFVPLSLAENFVVYHRPNGHPTVPQLLASIKGFNIVGWLDAVYTVPQRIGSVHLDKIDLLRYPAIRRFSSYAAAEQEILCSR